MPSDRLKEAMKATAYNHQKVAKQTDFTGKADEEPAQNRPQKPPRPKPDPSARVEHQRRRQLRQRTTERVTTEDEVNRLAVEDDDSAPPQPSRSTRLPADPFPLAYKDGDPDHEFECE